MARFCVVKLFTSLNALALSKKVETVEAATFFTKSTVAVCEPVALVKAVGAEFTPDHALLADKNVFFIDVNVAWA